MEKKVSITKNSLCEIAIKESRIDNPVGKKATLNTVYTL